VVAAVFPAGRAAHVARQLRRLAPGPGGAAPAPLPELSCSAVPAATPTSATTPTTVPGSRGGPR
jgi:hypothetical protein